jgi:hypothetical protein
MTFTTRNHYVPQWYQRRFLVPGGEGKFFYLDRKPDVVRVTGGRSFMRRAVLRWGPPRCFKEDHLYTTRLGQFQSDEIERRLFGPIDAKGERAVEFFSNYGFRKGVKEAFQDLVEFMDAQRLRTPKGLDLLRTGGGIRDNNAVLFTMQGIRHVHATVWTEGVWEILSCSGSPTKFIISDHPVTTYNKRCFPGSTICQYPQDAPIDMIGTHTIFPLELEHCLVITNLQYVRDLDANLLKRRTNSRAFQPGWFDLREIHTHRELAEDDVRALNYIIKMRAARYVAAAREDWLYPERHLATVHWSKLGSPHFLMPDSRLVKFSTGLFVKHGDGSVSATDEYGRRPNDEDPDVKRQRDLEWRAYVKSHKVFEALRGPIAPEVYRRML